MKTNKSKYALLGLLKFKAMSGYEIKKHIENSISNFWNDDFGRIYPELNRMLKEGLVSKQHKVNEKGPDSNIYSINAKGEQAFQDWINLPVEKFKERNELLLKIFFSRFSSKANAMQKIQEELLICNKKLQKLEKIEKALKEAESQEHNEDHYYWLVTLRYGKHMAQATKNWCEESIVLLDNLNEPGEIL